MSGCGLPSAVSLALVNFSVQRASMCFWRALAGSSGQAPPLYHDLYHDFSLMPGITRGTVLTVSEFWDFWEVGMSPSGKAPVFWYRRFGGA